MGGTLRAVGWVWGGAVAEICRADPRWRGRNRCGDASLGAVMEGPTVFEKAQSSEIGGGCR